MVYFAFLLSGLDLGMIFFNRLDPEVDCFYTENGLEVTFKTTLQNRKAPNAQLCKLVKSCTD